MTRIMFRELIELKSDIVVDKLLETTSIANYSKSAHRMRAYKTCLYYYYYNPPGSLPVQLVACQSKDLIQQSQLQLTK